MNIHAREFMNDQSLQVGILQPAHSRTSSTAQHSALVRTRAAPRGGGCGPDAREDERPCGLRQRRLAGTDQEREGRALCRARRRR